MNLRLNYRSVNILHPMDLVYRRHKQSEKNMYDLKSRAL